MSTTGYTDERLREIAPEVVLSKNKRNNKRLHIPDDGEPLCDTELRSKEWRVKPVSCYPPSWSEWCDRCIEKLRERERAEASPTPTWILTGDVRMANALEEDW